MASHVTRAPQLWRQAPTSHHSSVLLPNPRGSLGWGTEFAERILGDFGEIAFSDILAGVDHCVENGLADPDRIGIFGWSSSGFLASLATARTNQFAAAVIGSAVVDWRAVHHTIPDFMRMMFDDDPYREGSNYEKRSPLRYVEAVSTPTLIIHGSYDALIPVDQAHAWFKGLQEHGVDVELVIYAGTDHAIRNRRHQRDIFRRVVSFFAKHLAATPN